MDGDWLGRLNEQQRSAVVAGDDPLLIIAGAGTGKTDTLAHRVARLINDGMSPERIALLTFTRRASAEMTRRVEGIVARLDPKLASITRRMWAGTFHSIGARLLREYATPLGLGEAFTVMDKSDAEDLLADCRSSLGFDRGDVRFPRKETCLAIYSRCVNAREPIEDVLANHFEWCKAFPVELRQLFAAYTRRKLDDNVLDYDDLLLWWSQLLADETLAADLRSRFDAVLVDEYQDTNKLQAAILRGLVPSGRGLTVVGDDAQAIYSFRAATVDNILEFPRQFENACVVKLEQNYRSSGPILAASNGVIGQAKRRHAKELFTAKVGGARPRLVVTTDEPQQCEQVIARVLEQREGGIDLRKQAVLFRAAHHSDALEVELSRRGIPFVKYGGLKFLEAMHVKDVLAILRLAENPRDAISAARVLLLLEGVGPASMKKAIAALASAGHDFAKWEYLAPVGAAVKFDELRDLLVMLRPDTLPLPEQVRRVRLFYTPILEKKFDAPEMRRRDLEQLEAIAGSFTSRGKLLTDLTLDPPASTQDLAGTPLMEEDFLILSTIHSAKGCEWDCVYVIHAADGNIPSDMATRTEDEIEEERRLFYVALTRAKQSLDVLMPLKYYAKNKGLGDRHSYGQLTRFLPADVAKHFDRVTLSPTQPRPSPRDVADACGTVRGKIAAMWG